MLLILLPIAWLTVLTVLVAVCRMAAAADGTATPVSDEPGETIREGLVVWDDAGERVLRPASPARDMHAPRRERSLHTTHASARARRVAAHGSR